MIRILQTTLYAIFVFLNLRKGMILKQALDHFWLSFSCLSEGVRNDFIKNKMDDSHEDKNDL